MRQTGWRVLVLVLIGVTGGLSGVVLAADLKVPVEVSGAWIPEPPAVSRNAAAYITVLGGSQDDVLVGAATQAAEVVEVHETSLSGGVLRMKPVATLAVPARQRIEFAPGGLHLMLVNLRQALRYGATVPLELEFRKAGKVRVEAEVRSLPPSPTAVGGEAHHHHHHHH